MKFLFFLENNGNAEEMCNFVPEKVFSGIKSDFVEFCLNPGGEYRITITCSIMERKSL